MRDPQRIPRILAKIEELWTRHPDMRLGQLVSNAARLGGWNQNDVFYVEDDKTEKGLDALKEYKPTTPAQVESALKELLDNGEGR
jgi:hypothetical protein